MRFYAFFAVIVALCLASPALAQTYDPDYGGPVQGAPDGFNAAFYLRQNPDVATAIAGGWAIDPLTHRMQYGSPTSPYYDRKARKPYGTPWRMGVNLDGFEYNAGDPNAKLWTSYPMPSEATFAYLQSKGITEVRFPMAWERLQPVIGGPLDPGTVADVRATLDAAGRHGVFLLLDLHNFGGRKEGLLGSAGVPIGALADFWTRFAAAVKDHPALRGYDLMNEPHGFPSYDEWPNAAQAAIVAIRKLDTTHRIYVEGDNWSSATNWVASNPRFPLKGEGLIYSAHLYFDRDASGTYQQSYADSGATPTIGIERLSSFAGWLKANGVKGDIGEIGAPADAPWLVTLENTVAYAKAQDITAHYWLGGEWTGNDKSSIQPGSDGADKPQMAIVAKPRW